MLTHQADLESENALLRQALADRERAHALESVERQLQLAALQASEARFRALLDWTPEAIVVHRSGRIVYVNPAAITLFGAASASALINLPILDLIHPDFHELHSGRIQQLVQRKSSVAAVNSKFLRMDGSAFDSEVLGTFIEYEGQPAVHAVIRDISERLRVESARQESELRLQTLIESIPDAIFFKDGESRYRVVNDSGKQLFGFSDPSWYGKTDRELALLRPERELLHRMCTESDEAAWNAGGQVSSSEKMRLENGEALDYDVRKVPLFDEQGRRMALVIVGQDVTERNRIDATLKKTAQQLKLLSKRVLEVQEAERRRIAIELHDELGQSLTTIKINVQMLARDLNLKANASIDENMRIIDCALNQVRQLALALRPSVLDDLGLAAALRWHGRQAAKRGDFQLTFAAEFSDCRFDTNLETSYFRIAQEAVTNIWRHAKASHVEMTLRREGDELVMRITDDGCGFDELAMRGRAVTGESMGLLGMRERAMLIGGGLEVTSSPGKGCIVLVKCPWHVTGTIA